MCVLVRGGQAVCTAADKFLKKFADPNSVSAGRSPPYPWILFLFLTPTVNAWLLKLILISLPVSLLSLSRSFTDHFSSSFISLFFLFSPSFRLDSLSLSLYLCVYCHTRAHHADSVIDGVSCTRKFIWCIVLFNYSDWPVSSVDQCSHEPRCEPLFVVITTVLNSSTTQPHVS